MEYRKALKNYTTTQSADRLISKIQTLLVTMGASGIMFTYENGLINGVQFMITVDGSPRGFKLPLMTEQTAQVLRDQNQFKDDYHAYRVSLANVLDWLDAQLALLATKMVKFEQVMLPYMVSGSGKTLYETVRDNGFLLTDGA